MSSRFLENSFNYVQRLLNNLKLSDFLVNLQLAIDLESETKDHLPLLDGLVDDMESGSMRLGGTSGRLRNMGRTRGLTGRRFSCYIGLALCMFMLFVYYVLLPMALK